MFAVVFLALGVSFCVARDPAVRLRVVIYHGGGVNRGTKRADVVEWACARLAPAKHVRAAQASAKVKGACVGFECIWALPGARTPLCFRKLPFVLPSPHVVVAAPLYGEARCRWRSTSRPKTR